MPSLNETRPLTDVEKRKLEERDHFLLQSDRYQWYDFLYQDAARAALGAYAGYIPPIYTYNITGGGGPGNITIPAPNLIDPFGGGGGGNSPAQPVNDVSDELWDTLMEMGMGGGEMTVPPCILAKKEKASDIPGVNVLKDTLNKRNSVNVKWPQSQLDKCSSILDGFSIEHVKYIYGGVLGNCETDGVQAVVRMRNGSKFIIGPFAYKDGPSEWKCWATKTLAQVLEELWEQLRPKIKQDCCW